MRKIFVKSLSLVNFKGVRELDLQFVDGENMIGGSNGTGKTTVFDAFTWLMFGKDSTGRSDSNFNIKLMRFDCPGYEIRIITDYCLIIPAVALMLFRLAALIKAPQFKGLLIHAAHSVLRGIQVQEGRCLRTTSGIRVLMKNQKIQCHFFIPPAPHCFLLMQCRKSSVGSQSLMTSTNAERG